MLRKVAMLIVLLWSGASAHAQQSLGRSEIMLSRGTIFTFRESLSPRTFADIFNGRECANCHYVLAPGELVLTYPSRQPALAAGRIPILTKAGVFGSARGFSDSGYEHLVSEAEIERMRAARADTGQRVQDWLITVRDQQIERDLSFTRGEILPMEKVGGVAIVKIRKSDERLSQKFAELRASRLASQSVDPQSRISISDTEARVAIGSDDADESKFVKINFDEFAELVSRRPISGWGQGDLSGRWPRMLKSASPSLRVGCNEEVTLSSSTETENNKKARASFELGFKELLKFAELGLSAGIDFSEKYKQSISSTEKITKQGFELNSIAYVSPFDGVSVSHVGNEIICPGAPQERARLFRAAVPGVGDWAVTIDTYRNIAKEFEKDKAVVWEQDSGKLVVSCYHSGFRHLKSFLNRILSNEVFTDAILTQSLRLNYARPGNSVIEFFSC